MVMSYRRDASKVPQKGGSRRDINCQMINKSHGKEEALPLSIHFPAAVLTMRDGGRQLLRHSQRNAPI